MEFMKLWITVFYRVDDNLGWVLGVEYGIILYIREWVPWTWFMLFWTKEINNLHLKPSIDPLCVYSPGVLGHEGEGFRDTDHEPLCVMEQAW